MLSEPNCLFPRLLSFEPMLISDHVTDPRREVFHDSGLISVNPAFRNSTILDLLVHSGRWGSFTPCPGHLHPHLPTFPPPHLPTCSIFTQDSNCKWSLRLGGSDGLHRQHVPEVRVKIVQIHIIFEKDQTFQSQSKLDLISDQDQSTNQHDTRYTLPLTNQADIGCV